MKTRTQTLNDILAGNSLYLGLWLLFMSIGLFFLLSVGKADAFVDLNPYHQSVLDKVFVWITFLGDGLFSVIVFVIFLLRRSWSKAAQIILAFLLSALAAQLIKNFFHSPRPRQFFAAGQYPYFIEGVTRLGFASFPSGHSTSVFALATLLAFFTPNRGAKIACLLGAVAVGYSRIYLGNHFLGDVLTGSCIGTVTAILVHWLFLGKLQRFPVFAKG